jgi:hypothetical protein
LFDEFLARTVMVADTEPSEGMDVTLDMAVSVAGTTVAVVVPVVPVVPVVVVPDSPVMACGLPPHAANNAAAATQAIIRNLRIRFLIPFGCIQSGLIGYKVQIGS